MRLFSHLRGEFVDVQNVKGAFFIDARSYKEIYVHFYAHNKMKSNMILLAFVAITYFVYLTDLFYFILHARIQTCVNTGA